MYPTSSTAVGTSGGFQMVAPLSAAVPAVAASQQLSHGIRQVRHAAPRVILNPDRNSEQGYQMAKFDPFLSLELNPGAI